MTQIKLKIYKDKLLPLSTNGHLMHVSDEELFPDSDTMHACMLALEEEPVLNINQLTMNIFCSLSITLYLLLLLQMLIV